MRGTITAAVTGVGSTIGLGIAKALRMSQIECRIVGVDSNKLSVGLFCLDANHNVPSANEGFDRYYQALCEVCQQEQVDIIFSGWDGELLALGGERDFESDSKGTIVAHRAEGVASALDKWATFQILSGAGVPTPLTARADDKEALESFLLEVKAPYIMKPRRGAGSRGLYRVSSQSEIDFLSRYLPDPVIQEELLPAEEEYTVGVFMLDGGKEAGSMVLRRSLMSGLSYRMEVVQASEISAVAIAAVRALGLVGAVNVQLRNTISGPKVFEINPRFSSSSCVRAHFGFNEAEMAIQYFLWSQQPPAPNIRAGMCLRYWEEMYLPVANFNEQPSFSDKGYSCGLVTSA